MAERKIALRSLAVLSLLLTSCRGIPPRQVENEGFIGPALPYTVELIEDKFFQDSEVAQDRQASVTRFLELINQVSPDFNRWAKYAPGGFQIDVYSARYPVSFEEFSNNDMISSLAGLGRPTTSTRIGVLNITGAGTEQLSFDYRSKIGGRNMAIEIAQGKITTSMGVPLEVACNGISRVLINIFDFDGSRDIPIIVRNLSYFDQEGNPL